MSSCHDTTVVICSHLIQRWDWLQACVSSVEAQTLQPAEIIVVVDGDHELAAIAVAQLRTRCTVIPLARRGGLSAARNAGLDAVTTPFVAFLDDDACADPHWLERLRAELTRPEILGAGGRSLPVWKSRRPAWLTDQLLWAVGCSYEGQPHQASDVRNVFGGCAIYRTYLFTEYGGFRTEFGRKERGAAGCEETEFCLRVVGRRPKSVFRFQPEAVILHHVPEARTRLRYVMLRSFAEGRSKALLVRSLQSLSLASKLSAETEYARSALTRGVTAGMRQCVRGDLSGLASSGALVVSLGTAAVGYLFEMLVELRP